MFPDSIIIIALVKQQISLDTIHSQNGSKYNKMRHTVAAPFNSGNGDDVLLYVLGSLTTASTSGNAVVSHVLLDGLYLHLFSVKHARRQSRLHGCLLKDVGEMLR